MMTNRLWFDRYIVIPPRALIAHQFLAAYTLPLRSAAAITGRAANCGDELPVFRLHWQDHARGDVG